MRVIAIREALGTEGNKAMRVSALRSLPSTKRDCGTRFDGSTRAPDRPSVFICGRADLCQIACTVHVLLMDSWSNIAKLIACGRIANNAGITPAGQP
jgi:hypothetical protein